MNEVGNGNALDGGVEVTLGDMALELGNVWPGPIFKAPRVACPNVLSIIPGCRQRNTGSTLVQFTLSHEQ
jgi:hypothetical protein